MNVHWQHNNSVGSRTVLLLSCPTVRRDRQCILDKAVMLYNWPCFTMGDQALTVLLDVHMKVGNAAYSNPGSVFHSNWHIHRTFPFMLKGP